MKTKIFSFTFNRPDILEYQIKLLKKFIIGDYDINIVYDTRDNQYYEQFKKICEDNEVNFYHHVSQPGASPSFYNAQAIKWAYDNIILKEDDCIVMLLDHDMFLIDDFDIVNEMSSYDVVGCRQSREHVEYVWPGLCLFKKSSIENIEFDFYPQTVDGQMLDTGGGTYKLLSDKNIRFLDTGVEYPDEYEGLNLKDDNLTEGYNYELHFYGKFLHFRNASCWHTNYNVIENSRKDQVFQLILNSILEDDQDDILMKEYRLFSMTQSEINEHLPTLYSLAKECSSIVELGVCHGKSTRSLLASGTKLRSYDVWIEPKVLSLFEYAKKIGRDVEYINKNSVKTEIEECDMLFIDSWHNYYQLRKELRLHSNKAKKYIVFHDTVSCGSVGEDWRSWGNGSQIQYQTLCEDLDTDKIDTSGINSAIFEFLSEHPEWKVKKHYKNNNGLTVLEKNG